MAQSAAAQQGMSDAIANDSAADARVQQSQSPDYTFKKGDFRMLVVPALSLQWNDNVYLSQTRAEDDITILPTVAVTTSYPLTDRNLLQFDVTLGYNEYLSHDSLSTWYLQSGSGLSFDMYIKDVLVNFHDQFSFVQDSALNPAVANTGTFGTFQNSVGTTISWGLKNIVFTLGYDHQNGLSTSGDLSQADHSAETGYARVGYKWNPRLTTGFETTASSTAYAETVLNDNVSYSIGVYGDWQPSDFLHVQPRAGYVIDEFSQSSRDLRTSDVNSWYADLNIKHDITRSISYSLDIGREVDPGIQSDVNINWHVNSSIIWNVIKGNSIRTAFFFQHGNQGQGSSLIGNLANPNLVSEVYDWYGGEIGLSHALTSRWSLSLDYRITQRGSSTANRGYTQNLVSIQLMYQPGHSAL